MNRQDLDLNNPGNPPEDSDDVTMEGGVDSKDDDGCEGGTYKI